LVIPAYTYLLSIKSGAERSMVLKRTASTTGEQQGEHAEKRINEE
jgi:hypothetical protein